MMRRSLLAAAAAAFAAVTLVSGCGVPVDDAARPVKGFQTPQASSTPALTETPTARVALWFVDGDALRRVEVADVGQPTPENLLGLLATPPDRTDLRTLVSDPQGGSPLASVASASPSSVTGAETSVALADTFPSLAASDQVLLIGQVVLTLTEPAGGGVSFVDAAGAPVAVPLPDGRLVGGPVLRSDYMPLATASP